MQREPGKKKRVEKGRYSRQGDEDASEKRSTEKRTDEQTDEKVVLDQLQERPVRIERLQLFRLVDY